MKTLNIKMTVRRMEAQNILTTSGSWFSNEGIDGSQVEVAGRTATPAAPAPGSFRN